MTSAWFCAGELDAMLRSSAYPADEYDQPDCGATTQDDRGTVACTRQQDHPGRHLAALRGTLEGVPLFAVLAAWPGTERP